MQLLLDGRVGFIPSLGYVCATLGALVVAIGMTAVGEPKVEEFEEYGFGISVCQFLAESHIIVNYMYKYICIDIFSCKDFNAKKARDFCVNWFDIVEITFEELLHRSFK